MTSAARAAGLLLALTGLTLSGFTLSGTACRSADPAPDPPPEPRSEQDVALDALVAFEDARRAATDFAARPDREAMLGPDPYVVARAGTGWVGLLRGANALVLLDADLREVDRVTTPALASALAVTPGGEVLAGGEAGRYALRFRITEDGLDGGVPLDLRAGDESRGIRALAVHASGTVFAVDEANDALVVAPESVARPFAISVAAAPFRVETTAHFVVVASLVGHALTVFSLDPAGVPASEPVVIRRDGPPWSIALHERDGELLIASGGVEDRPLDRTHGSFENVDPFVYIDRVGSGRAVRLHAVDVGELGVLTPKAMIWTDDGARLRVVGSGSPRGVDLAFSRVDAPPVTTTFAMPPGTSSIALGPAGEIVAANPLLDAFVMLGAQGVRVVPAHHGDGATRGAPARSDGSRLGEVLFFTSLLAPWQSSAGPLSRFTCETCHFEGGIDGRTHATGRGDVRATTKPLVGLFGNGPYFTRALDPDLSHMVHAEFRVASARSEHDPWFPLEEALAATGSPTERAWLEKIPFDGRPDGTPLGLRRAFAEFLMDFTPPTNPRVIGRARFTSLESDGADVFSERCASCHAARLVASDPASEVPRESWEAHVFGTGPGDAQKIDAGALVWARQSYEKAGIEPYVHELGARPPSLRRLARKRPYFTNGSAQSIDAVLDAVRAAPDGTLLHGASAADPRELELLAGGEKEALRAFLSLL